MLIDITLTLNQKTKIYPGDPAFNIKKVYFAEKDGFNLSALSLGTHTGTHIDAPMHFFNNKKGCADLDLKYLITNSLAADVSGLKLIDEKFLLSLNLKNINSVLFKTSGKNIYLTKSGAEYLIEKKILIVGTDNMDIEDEADNTFPVHKTLLFNNTIILENIDLSNISAGKYKLYCFPLKIENADGSPVRAVLEK